MHTRVGPQFYVPNILQILCNFIANTKWKYIILGSHRIPDNVCAVLQVPVVGQAWCNQGSFMDTLSNHPKTRVYMYFDLIAITIYCNTIQ